MGSVTYFNLCLTLTVYISTHTLRGERDVETSLIGFHLDISTHTLRGERDGRAYNRENGTRISTHTLRGERDRILSGQYLKYKFQLTRSVGSVTRIFANGCKNRLISTHTLRGERDESL